MDRDGIQRFLDALGAENIRDDGEWLHCSCPLAPWLHSKGTDSRPSFGIRVNESGPSGWYCFSCDMGGSLPRLIHALWWNSEEYPSEAGAVFWDEEVFGDFDVLRIVKRHPKVFPPRLSSIGVPKEILDDLPLTSEESEIYEYLTDKRRISKETLDAFMVRERIDNDGESWVVFPIISRRGEVLDMYVRSVKGKRFFRLNAEMTGSRVEYRCNHLLFGNHLIDRDKPIWITEAPLDAMRLHTLGVRNVGATCGPAKQEIFKNLYAPRGLVLAFDSDDSGRRFAKRVRALVTNTIIHQLNWALVGKKDANELDNVAEIRKVLEKRLTFQPRGDG